MNFLRYYTGPLSIVLILSMTTPALSQRHDECITISPECPYGDCTYRANQCESRHNWCIKNNNCHELTLFTKNCHDSATPAENLCKQLLSEGKDITAACLEGVQKLHDDQMCLGNRPS